MANRPAPRPKSSKAKGASRPAGKHSVGARNYRRVKESQKWNKGPVA